MVDMNKIGLRNKSSQPSAQGAVAALRMRIFTSTSKQR
jgi:hypothetical protein